MLELTILFFLRRIGFRVTCGGGAGYVGGVRSNQNGFKFSNSVVRSMRRGKTKKKKNLQVGADKLAFADVVISPLLAGKAVLST